jgi:DivIVA domain-containing protein
VGPTPDDIRAKAFAMTTDGGYSTVEVREFLDRVALLIEAGAAGSLTDQMKDEAKQLIGDARLEAEEIRQRARREALALLEVSRRDAEDLIRAAQEEYEKLRSRSTAMRTRLREAEAAMNALAVDTLPRLAAVQEDLSRPVAHDGVEVTVVPDSVVGLEMLQDMSSADMDFDAAVNLLLAQFREATAAGAGASI